MANKIQKRESNFTQVSNSFLRDSNISFKAKGLFCYMFSMSEDWNFTIRSIAKQQKDGEASIISAMNELKEYGYITYTKHQDGTGTYFLDDEPKHENPNVENPNLGKSTRIKKTELTKNKNTKNIKNKQKEISNNEKWIREYFDTNHNLNLTSALEWIEYKSNSYKQIGITKVCNFLVKYDLDTQKEIVNNSIMNNYKGLFEPKQKQPISKRERSNQMVDEVFAELERNKNSNCEYEGEIYEYK